MFDNKNRTQGTEKREFNLKNSHVLTEFATDREDEGEKGKINEEPLFCRR